jgi:hypothetical protein
VIVGLAATVAMIGMALIILIAIAWDKFGTSPGNS